jgi:NIPSNAP
MRATKVSHATAFGKNEVVGHRIDTFARTKKGTSMTLNRWTAFGIVLVSFAAGSLITARLAHTSQVRADGNRVFELRVYHAVPGKLPALESRFRDKTSKILANHNLNVVGYWTTEDTPTWDNTFVFLLAHPSWEEARKNWDAMRADPEFQEIAKSEQAEKTLEKAEVIHMRPADFSSMK